MKPKSVLALTIGLVGLVSLMVAGGFAGGGVPGQGKPRPDLPLIVTVYDINPEGRIMGIRSDGPAGQNYATYIDGVSNVEARLDKWGGFSLYTGASRKIILDWTQPYRPDQSYPVPTPPDMSSIQTFTLNSAGAFSFLSLTPLPAPPSQPVCSTTGSTRCASFQVYFPGASDVFYLNYQWSPDWSKLSPTAPVWVTRTSTNTWILQSSGLSECGCLCPADLNHPYNPDIAHLWRYNPKGRSNPTDRGYFSVPFYIKITAQ